MAEIENSIAQCCKQLRLSTNFAGQALTLEGDTPQKYLLNLLENVISYRIEKRKSKYRNTAGFPRRYWAEEFKTDEIDFPDMPGMRCEADSDEDDDILKTHWGEDSKRTFDAPENDEEKQGGSIFE